MYLYRSNENFQKWKTKTNYIQRRQFLNGILVTNILTFASSQKWRLPIRLETKIININETRMVKIHGTKRMVFSLTYESNIDLPPKLALGKSISFGFGVQEPI